jgi:hypothetical protein
MEKIDKITIDLINSIIKQIKSTFFLFFFCKINSEINYLMKL